MLELKDVGFIREREELWVFFEWKWGGSEHLDSSSPFRDFLSLFKDFKKFYGRPKAVFY